MTALTLTACGGSDNDSKAPEPVITPQPKAELIAFAPDNKVEASIKWTTYGVPHITGNNLESIGFGSGYAYAKDNACIMADQIIKIRSERAKFFGPDKEIGSGDSKNIISDFGHLGLQVMAKAKEKYPDLTENTRALVEGYVAGYNQYLETTGIDNLPSRCAGQPWVKPIEPQELIALIFSTSQMASGLRFLEPAFFANPGIDDEYKPYIEPKAANSTLNNNATYLARLNKKLNSFPLTVKEQGDMGSNAWGFGKEVTENGKGILLANPHFPFTGHLRFWQSHVTIPGVLNVTGGSLQGMPGIINIGFNKNLAWTHTVSDSNRFALYQLTLDESSPLKYQYDNEVRDIEKKTFYVEVNAGSHTIVMAKDFYYSHHGLMIETPAEERLQAPWTDKTAFTLRDSAEFNSQLVDQWLAINLSENLEEFQQAFKDFNGIPWVNTIYTDKEGNAFYIDGSMVLDLNDTALALIRSEPQFFAFWEAAGFYIFPGNTSIFEPTGLNGYDKAPKILRHDYVQNSNDSYWATNTKAPMSGYSLLYGPDNYQLTLRSRMGLAMVGELLEAGEIKVTAEAVEQSLMSNRSYLAELVLVELLEQCKAQGDKAVLLDNGTSVNIQPGCQALEGFDGTMNQDSTGAHIFREFAYEFTAWNEDLTTPFDPKKPATTPNTLSKEPRILQILANIVATFDQADISLNARLADLQFTEKTAISGQGSGTRFPWGGANHEEGGFNVFNTANNDDTLYPMHAYPIITDATTGEPVDSRMSKQGYHINRGSSWMFIVNFTDEGPKARGLTMYSQSIDPRSPHYDDQTKHYSENTSLRPILYTEAEINEAVIEEITINK